MHAGDGKRIWRRSMFASDDAGADSAGREKEGRTGATDQGSLR